MANAVDICNLALSHLGNKAEVSGINPPDGSVEAMHCSRFYPLARDSLLEMHPWGFAVRRVALALVGTPSADFDYQYQWPVDCLRPLAVYESGTDGEYPFQVESHPDHGRVILTDVEDAELRYIARAEDTTKFSPGFVSALSWLLAYHLAGPLTRNSKIQESAYRMFLSEFGRAATLDADGGDQVVGFRTLRVSYMPSSIKARG